MLFLLLHFFDNQGEVFSSGSLAEYRTLLANYRIPCMLYSSLLQVIRLARLGYFSVAGSLGPLAVCQSWWNLDPLQGCPPVACRVQYN